MANAVNITIPTSVTNARAGLFHGHKLRQSVLDNARASRRFLLNIAGNPNAHWAEKRLIANGVPSYFSTLRNAVKNAIKDAAFHAECAAAHAADMDAARHATPADRIRNEIHCLEMADRHDAANRAEVRRLQTKLAVLTYPVAIAA